MSSTQILPNVTDLRVLIERWGSDAKKQRVIYRPVMVLGVVLALSGLMATAQAAETDQPDPAAPPAAPELEHESTSDKATPLRADDAVAVTADTNGQQSSDVIAPTFIQRPQWEFGVGGGYFSGFDYPASNDENKRSLALPFFIYRSPLVRFGGGGIRAVAIENPRIKLDLSVGASLNSSSEGNSVREGMPDLDFLFEFGPQLEVRLFDQSLVSGARWRGRFTSELRAVLSTDFRGLDAQGFVAEFGLGFNLNNIGGSAVSLISALDVTFADERLHDYFYEVDSEFVTATRPEFDAQAGYLETKVFAAVAIQPLPRVRVFLGVSQGYFDGTANQDSPLFETTQQTSFALGIVWTIKKSKNMIDIVEMGVRN